MPTPVKGLTADQVAKITDAIISETNYTAEQIRLIEVKKPVDDTMAALVQYPEANTQPNVASAESELVNNTSPLELEGSNGLE